MNTNYVCGVHVNGFGLCRGDSGGPMVCKDRKGRAVLQGIVSGPGSDEIPRNKKKYPNHTDCREALNLKFANIYKYVKGIKRRTLVWIILLL